MRSSAVKQNEVKAEEIVDKRVLFKMRDIKADCRLMGIIQEEKSSNRAERG